MGLMEKIFGDLNEKEVKKVSKIADQVMAYDEAMQHLATISYAKKLQNSKFACRKEKHWTIYYLRLLRYVEKLHGEAWE